MINIKWVEEETVLFETVQIETKCPPELGSSLKQWK